jgi:glyoxylase-like metal-dependent hydrolase (beta-lactamase superfamily II)
VVSYTGDVKAGGPADTRELDSLTITKVAVDEQMSNNCYLLTCKHTGEAVLIDAAASSDVLLSLIGDRPLTHVITTHQHWDHHRALSDVVEATSAATVAGVPDAAAITEQTGVPVTIEVTQGDTVPVGDCTLEVIAIAGHTPGSIALLYTDPGGHPHLFTGDSLFPGGVGNTQGDAERFQQLIDDVSARIFDRLPDDTWFYPGHGSDSTIGAERPHLGDWGERGW